MPGELDSLAEKYSGGDNAAIVMQAPSGGPLDDLAAQHAPEQPQGTWAGNPALPGGETRLMGQPLQLPKPQKTWRDEMTTLGRGAATGIGAGLGGVAGFFSPVPGGLAAGTLLGGGIGKKLGEVAFGPEEPEAPPINPAAGQGFAANARELISNIPVSAARTATGALGSMSDLSTAAVTPGGGQAILQGMGQSVKALGEPSAWVMNPVGNLATLGMVAEPIRVPVGAALGKVAGAVSPESLYASALKMSTGKSLSIPERAARVQTGLKGGYIPSEAGYGKLLDDIGSVNDQIGNKIQQAKAGNKMVSVDSVLEPLKDIRNRAQYDINPQPLMEKIDTIESNLRDHPLSIDTPTGQMIPVDVAQKMKIETYRGLRKAYGEMQSTEIEARKAVARGLKEQIVAAVPELAELNAQDSSLINLEKSLGQATKRIANRDLVGIGGPMKLAAGGVADILGGGGLGVTSGALLWALDNPIIKSKLAVSLYRARNVAGKAVSMPAIKAEVDNLATKIKDKRGLVGPDINAGALRPATVRNGKVWVAPEGKTHYDVNQATSIPFDAATQKPVGFVTPEGIFLDRQQSLDWLRQNRPDVYKALDSVTKKKGLESQAYAHAAGIMTPEAIEMRDFMRRQFGK